VIHWNGASYNSLSAFSAATGHETHGVTNRPNFLNPAAHDYYLSIGSALIDKGIAISGINDNWLGAAPDPGALEHGMQAQKISRDTNGIRIDWLVGVFGKYQLEFTTNITQSVWTSLRLPVIAESALLSLVDPTTTAIRRFYRLREVSP